MSKQVEMPPDLNEEDNQILDSIWDNMSQQSKKSKSSNNKKEALKKALEVLNHLVSDIGSDED
jgi:hypothetical protein